MITLEDTPREALPLWHRVEEHASPVALQATAAGHTPLTYAGALLAFGITRFVVTGLVFVVLATWKPLALFVAGLAVAIALGIGLAVILGIVRLFGHRAFHHVWHHLVPRPHWHKVRMAVWGWVLPAGILRWAR